MLRRNVFGIMLLVVSVGMLTIPSNVHLVKGISSGTVYIRADGSVDPLTAPISTIDNVTYTFTGDIFGGLDIEKDNIIIDGANYTLHASGYVSGWPTAVLLSGRTNVTIEYVRIDTVTEGIYVSNSSGNRLFRNTITLNETGIHLSLFGIVLFSSSNSSVCENNVRLAMNASPQNGVGIALLSSSCDTISANKIEHTFEAVVLQDSAWSNVSANTIGGNYYGVGVVDASNDTISENVITSGKTGIDLERCSNIVVFRNNVTENSDRGIVLYPGALRNILRENYIENSYHGITLWRASNNSIYHNYLANNSQQVYILESGYNNSWDDGYPSGGNYWSNYAGIDLKSGPFQNLTGSDGIGDTPYTFDANNEDHYPLTVPYGSHLPLAFPSASFVHEPVNPTAGQLVVFNASVSTCLNGSIKSYEWNFGDGYNGTGQTVSHVYGAKGNYNVTLKVVSSTFILDSQKQLVDVKERPLLDPIWVYIILAVLAISLISVIFIISRRRANVRKAS